MRLVWDFKYSHFTQYIWISPHGIDSQQNWCKKIYHMNRHSWLNTLLLVCPWSMLLPKLFAGITCRHFKPRLPKRSSNNTIICSMIWPNLRPRSAPTICIWLTPSQSNHTIFHYGQNIMTSEITVPRRCLQIVNLSIFSWFCCLNWALFYHSIEEKWSNVSDISPKGLDILNNWASRDFISCDLSDL